MRRRSSDQNTGWGPQFIKEPKKDKDSKLDGLIHIENKLTLKGTASLDFSYLEIHFRELLLALCNLYKEASKDKESKEPTDPSLDQIVKNIEQITRSNPVNGVYKKIISAMIKWDKIPKAFKEYMNTWFSEKFAIFHSDFLSALDSSLTDISIFDFSSIFRGLTQDMETLRRDNVLKFLAGLSPSDQIELTRAALLEVPTNVPALTPSPTAFFQC